MICASVSVLSFWLRFEKVCCIKSSPTGESSLSFSSALESKNDHLMLSEAQTEANEVKPSTSVVLKIIKQ